MKRILGICVTVCLALGACTHLPRVQSRIVTGPVAPPFHGEVRVVMHDEPPPQEYVEVALIKAMNDEGRQHALADLKQEAASLGCNAIVDVSADSLEAIGVAVHIPPSAP